MKRVLVCGGRDFDDYAIFRSVMNTIAEQYFDKQLPDKYGNYLYDAMIISGGARGVDQFAIDWAIVENLPFKEFPADWDQHGKKAGYLRNKQMLEEGKPDIVIAFPGGIGTAMMVDMAKKANVLILQIEIGPNGMFYIDDIKPPELKTGKYKALFIEKVKNLANLTPSQRRIIFCELLAEERQWLDNMGKDYDEIMGMQDIMDNLKP